MGKLRIKLADLPEAKKASIRVTATAYLEDEMWGAQDAFDAGGEEAVKELIMEDRGYFLDQCLILVEDLRSPPDMKDTGWSVIEDGVINVRSVSHTREGAIVNWLCLEKNILLANNARPEFIERAWEKFRGTAQVDRIRLSLFKTVIGGVPA